MIYRGLLVLSDNLIKNVMNQNWEQDMHTNFWWKINIMINIKKEGWGWEMNRAGSG